MTITLPKSFILFQPAAIRYSDYQQQKPVPGRLYHIAVGFRPGSVGAVSLCSRATVNKIEGYWFLIHYDELVKYDKAFPELICKRCVSQVLG